MNLIKFIIYTTITIVFMNPIPGYTNYESEKSNIQFVQRIVAETETGNKVYQTGDYFGSAVSIHGDLAIVGAKHKQIDHATHAGAAYILKKDHKNSDSWITIKNLSAKDAIGNSTLSPNLDFGASVAISKNYAFVCAPKQNVGYQEHAGCVYVFSKDKGGTDNWGFIKILSATNVKGNDDSEAYAGFGSDIALDGDTVIIGSEGYQESSGVAYICQKDQGGHDNWGTVAILLPQKKEGIPDSQSYAYFGNSVDLEGQFAVIGSKHKNGIKHHSGAAYVYRRQNAVSMDWVFDAKLSALNENNTPDQTPRADFGASISISKNRIAVGASMQKVDSLWGAGAVYLYRRNKGPSGVWQIEKKITATKENGAPYEIFAGVFGESVAIDGDRLAVGASGYKSCSGNVFMFKKNNNGINAWGIEKIYSPQSTPHISDWQDSGRFGKNIDLHDSQIISGAVSHDLDGAAKAGSAYIFETLGTLPFKQKKPKVSKLPTQPLGVNLSINMNTKKTKTSSELKSEYNTGEMGNMLGKNIYEFEATITERGLGYFCFNSSSLGNRRAADVNLYKLYPDKPSRAFTYSSSKKPRSDGYFWITDTAGQYVDPDNILEAGQNYTINYSVRDNGDFDLNPTTGIIHDPVVPGTALNKSNSVLSPHTDMSVELASFFIAALIGIRTRRFRRQ